MQKASEFEKNYTEVTNRQGFKDSKISFAELPTVGSKDSRIQGLASLSSLRSVQRFKDSKIQRFKD
jgi:hypothetical protein